ncbi:MAG: hypothetical protein ACKO9V_05905 [Candidatus Kapaibacterium sp.]
MSSTSSTLAVGLQRTAEAGLDEVQRAFHAYQSAHFPERSPEFFCLELCGEAGELANLEKKRWKGKDIEDARIAEEAADVCIALMNYANARGIDLGTAVRSKLERIEGKRADCERRGETY